MRIVVLASGSTGNSSLVQWDGGSILIDAGISARRIRTMLREQGVELRDLSAILITHEHTDHISGLSVLLRQQPLPVFAVAPTANYLRRQMCEHAALITDAEADCFSIGNANITPIPTLHDASGSCGWRIETQEGVFGLCTDLGVVTEEVLDGLCGADIALIESNHDVQMLLNGPYPLYLKRRILSEYGHLSNDAAADLAVTLCANGTRQLILGHLSRHNNTPAKALCTVETALHASLPEELLPLVSAAPEIGPMAAYTGVEARCSL